MAEAERTRGAADATANKHAGPSCGIAVEASSGRRDAHDARTVRRAPEPSSDADRAMRPLPEAGETDPLPDADAPEPAWEHPANGIAAHGSATSRKI